MYNIRSLFKYTIIAAAVVLFLQFSSCKDEPVAPPPDNQPLKDTVSVSAEDITHRSVTINIKTTNHNPPAWINLYRITATEQNQIAKYSASVMDTSVIDDNYGAGLSYNSNYRWYAVITDLAGKIKDSSNTVEARTLDTTSHDYTWQVFIPGGATYTNELYDVWGLDDNNVYAAGTVTINDTAYGVIKWDGEKWNPCLRRGGKQCIFGFSADDIWVAGNVVYHFNGQEWITISDSVLRNNIPYTAIWGSASNSVFFGSWRGKIIHWDGKKASVAADFGIPITDVFGTSENDIWITGSAYEPLLARFNGLSFEEITNLPSIPMPLQTVFPMKNKEIYIGGNGVFRKTGEQWTTENVNFTLGSIHRIRGTNSNNIFATGGYCTVHHFNGTTWKYYDELRTPEGGISYGVFVTENKVFIVGINNDHLRAKIVVGTRK